MKISIITICCNSAGTIRKTFDSVLNQTELPAEYIIIDGLSTDNTVSIIKYYESVFVNKGVLFKWISEKDNGLYDAMNKGLQLSAGDWVQFLNSDDFLVNKYVLEGVKALLEKSSASVVYGRTINIENWSQSVMPIIKEDKLKLNLLLGCPIQQPATFYRRELFVEGKYSFDAKYRISADYKMFVQMIQNHVRFQYIPLFVTCFDTGGVSTVNKNGLTFEEDIKLLEECGVSTVLMRLKHNRFMYKLLIVLFQLLSKR